LGQRLPAWLRQGWAAIAQAGAQGLRRLLPRPGEGLLLPLRGAATPEREVGHARLAGIVDSAMDAIVTVDAGQRVALFNAAAEAMFRCPAAEAVGSPLDRFIPERFRAAHREHFQKFCDSGATARSARHLGILSGLRADGEEFPIEASLSRAEVGGEILCTAILRDITHWKRTEAALRSSEARFRLLAETAARLLATEDTQGLIDTLSRKVMAQLDCQAFFNFLADPASGRLRLNACAGISEAEARELEWLDICAADCAAGHPIPPGSRKATASPACPLAGMIRGFGIEAYCCHPLVAGQRFLGTLSFGSKSRARFTPGEVELMRIVTGQVAAALQRLLAQQALRDSEERYRSLVEQSADGIFVCDPQGRYLDVNSAGAAMLGYRREELLRLSIPDVIAPEEIPRVAPETARFADGQAARSEWRLRRKDGSFFPGEIMGRQLPDGRLQAILRDTTERKEYEAKLLDQAERLRQADRRKDEFLALLAHELRNPLAPIRTAAASLGRPGLDPAQLARSREIIARQVAQLARLVDDLLDVSRITLGRIELRKEALEISAILRQAVETCQPLLDARRHQLSLGLPPEPLRVEGDPVRLEQVVSNLLNNAAKYTDAGGRIDLRAEPEGGDILIRVRDNGRGIESSALPRLFDLFYQEDPSLERAGGLGIGLSLVKRLAELHGGGVSAHSEGRGQGSEFVVRLPRLLDSPKPSLPGPEPPPAANLSVLVVDDNEDAAESLSLLLELDGHRVLTAHAGHAAVELALAARPQAVLLDIGLPGLDGYEACRRMRAGGLSQALIVAVTGYGQDADARRAEAAGFDAHLVKPVDPAAIQALLAAKAKSAR
jgi:PAS domain S-box-containing protein